MIAQPADDLPPFAQPSFWRRYGFGFAATHDAAPAASPVSGILASYDRARVQIPIWVMILLAMPFYPAAVALKFRWRRRRRRAANQCLDCGYDLRATPQRCPECGKVVGEPEASRWPVWRRSILVTAAFSVILGGAMAIFLAHMEQTHWPPRYAWMELTLPDDETIDGEVSQVPLVLGSEPRWFVLFDAPATERERHVFYQRLNPSAWMTRRLDDHSQAANERDPYGVDIEELPRPSLRPRDP